MSKVDLKKVYAPSESVVAREVQGEFIIIPITSGVGESEDEMFTLNESGRALWDSLDGKKKLNEIISELSSDFEAPISEVEKDCVGIMEELTERKLVVGL